MLVPLIFGYDMEKMNDFMEKMNDFIFYLLSLRKYGIITMLVSEFHISEMLVFRFCQYPKSACLRAFLFLRDLCIDAQIYQVGRGDPSLYYYF